MEVHVYNPQLNFLGIVEDYSSFLWNRKYSEAGSFEIHVPITADNVNYFSRGNIVSFKGAIEAGIVESIKANQNRRKNEMTVKGRFLESYLDRRLIYTNKSTFTTGTSHTFNYSGKTEKAMRDLILDAVAIPLMTIYNESGTDPGELHGFTEDITFQATFQNLLKYESKLADSAGFGFRCIPDFINKIIIFDVYKGLDHSESQSSRVRVTFSDGYKNIDNATYTENDQLLKNVCFVGGQGEGSERTWVVVGDTNSIGLARREVKLDATDINTDGLTTSQYIDKLSDRGSSLLEKEDILIQSFECDTLSEGNFKYKEHFDLGDIVTIKKENWGVTVDLRITAITEAYEHGKITIIPTFGKTMPDTIDWEDK